VTESSSSSVAVSLFSMALMLVASASCFVAWHAFGATSYILASVGFLVLAPLWYRRPVSAKALLGPVGGRLTSGGQFSWLDVSLAFVGYPLLLAAISLWVLAWYKA
jgi:hypothetical protein